MGNKKEEKVEAKAENESKLTVKTLGAIAGIIVTILGVITSGFIFIDDRYVTDEVYQLHVKAEEKALADMDTKIAAVIEAMQEQSRIELNKVYKAIKDGTALPLMVRRDILLARGDSLSSEERAELRILETKLDELNVQDD